MSDSTLTALTAISPVDGRYWNKLGFLTEYFSEFSLIKYRVFVEIEYFIALCQIPLPQLESIDKNVHEPLRDVWRNFTLDDATKVKNTERITNHDVKAIEYFVKEKFQQLGLEKYKEFVHFALTSQDINNTVIPYTLRLAVEKCYLPSLTKLEAKLREMALRWIAVPMLAHTHGQPATPTRVGKEIMVFVERLHNQLVLLEKLPFTAKFGGATGQFNAHYVAYPNVDWLLFADKFVSGQLSLSREQFTTQIAHYDSIAALCDNVKRINTILTDLARDMWTYVSMEYFTQKIVSTETGSSTMPHKVNPIDFENGEGNFGIANALFEFMSAKLPISRMQRDLTDSTVLRNLGVPFAHTLLAVQSLDKGLDKLQLNLKKLQEDLLENYAVVSEAIQTILRREGYPEPYEALKALTRTGQKITEESMKKFIETLNVSEGVKEELRAITPFTYIGVLPKHTADGMN